MSMTKDGQELCKAVSTELFGDVRASPALKDKDQYWEVIFAKAALGKALPGPRLGQVMFNFISFWLLFGMFSKPTHSRALHSK